MRALTLNFERRPPGTRLGWGILALGALLAILAILAQATISAELETQAAALPRPTARREPAVLPGGVASEADAIAGARAVVGHLAGPGEKPFVTLEAVAQPDVALLALTRDTGTRSLRILAEARNFDAMLAYLRVLEQSRAFTQVALVEHEIQDRDPQRPLRFSLAAAWGP